MAGSEESESRPLDASITYEYARPPDRRSVFTGTLLDASETRIILAGELKPSSPLVVRGRVVLDAGYRAIWFLFKDQPFDVARVYRPDGSWTGYYSDVLEPVRWSGDDPQSLLPLVDLFLDVWIDPDGAVEVLDEDELRDAVRRRAVTREQAEEARSVLRWLVEATGRGDFPPNEVRNFVG